MRDHAAVLTDRYQVPVSHTHLWAIGLEVEDERRTMPSDDLKAAIEAYTGGWVTAARHWPPLPSRREPVAQAIEPGEQSS